MKTFLLFVPAILAGNFLFSQHNCQGHHHETTQQQAMFKSGNEALRSDSIDVLNYDIYLDYTEIDLSLLEGSCEVKFTTLENVNSLSLDLLELTVDSIVMNGNQLAFSYNDTLLIAAFGTTLPSGSTDSLTVYYHGMPVMDPSGWGGFYATSGYYFNLGVGFQSYPHNYGRVWHPCFDNFVERATYTFNILTANNKTAYCNGTRTNVQSVGTDSLLTTWNMGTEIPSYLASVSVASYTHVAQVYNSTLQGISIPMWLTALPADTTDFKNSFIHLPDAMSAFEQFYGPYNWERVGFCLVPFSSGAMEHATNISYPLATVEGSTFYETLMAHELSHHWWGDWVTCTTAEEMWINEGMASYSERVFLEFVYGYDAYLDDVRSNHYDVLKLAHIRDSGYYALNAVPVQYTYGDHSYNKGSDVAHTMRGYFGDANFFAALQAVQDEFGGGNVSSFEFMTEMNTIPGVDATNFFNDWIFQPGFSQFSVVDFTSTPSGGSYTVDVVVDQKLKGGANHHTGVPLQLTFMDAAWNTHTEQIVMSGDYMAFTFTLPINPVFAGINLDEKINDATTAVHETISGSGIYTWTYANIRLDVSSVNDSAFVRVEHCWVYPDATGVPDNIQISQQRYWNIHGVDLANLNGEIRFDYNGKTITSGYLDHTLMVDLGNQAFSEDSLVLLYRPDDHSDWQVHTDYAHNFMGSHTDKMGNMVAQNIAAGQYTFGYRTNSVSVPEITADRSYTIYPNPATDNICIDLSKWEATGLFVEIYGIEGKLAIRENITGGQVNVIETAMLENATYLVVIKDANGQSIGSKRIVIGH
jgi:hypothetical protein